MLVLKRKVGEEIEIKLGDKILILSVEKLDGHYVSLGFEGPDDFAVWRTELLVEGPRATGGTR